MSVKDWSPLRGPAKELQVLATELVGDGKRPNIFFVSIEGRTVVISLDFDVAYDAWAMFSDVGGGVENTTLEDRQAGVIASIEPLEDGSGESVLVDNSETFGYR